MSIEVHPLTAERWADLEALFGPRGAYGGCWCMWWRLTGREFGQGAGEGNRRAMEALVGSGQVPGLLAYADGRPVGWCSVGPREAFGRIERSRVLKRVDDRPVWSIVCFYVGRGWRGRGLVAALLEAAVDYAAAQGAQAVEGYPLAPRQDRVPAMYAFRGLVANFERAGFRQVARRSPSSPVMRRELGRRG